jgi:hypothetical protein
MLKFNGYCDFLLCRIFRILFLLFLAVFIIYPIANATFDAHADYLNHSSVINDMDDDYGGDKHYTFHVFKHASEDYHATCITLFRQVLGINDPAYYIANRERSTPVIKSSRTYPPLSSDPSPPVI